MKTIKIRQDIKDKLDEFPNAKTITKTMKILVDNAETYEQYSSDNNAKTNINIHMDDKVFEKFRMSKNIPKEEYMFFKSYNNIDEEAERKFFEYDKVITPICFLGNFFCDIY